MLCAAVTVPMLFALGCSDAQRAAAVNLGQPALVLKYSGGKLVYGGISTGKIENETYSDGHYFNDKCQYGSLVEVAGDLVITRPAVMPTCEAIFAEVVGSKLGR